MEKFRKQTVTFLHKIATKAVQIEAEMLLRAGLDSTFINHVMAPEFDYKPHLKRINPYFAQWGFKFSMLEAEYFSTVNGKKSDLYIPTTFFYQYLMPFLGISNKYADKNLFRKLLDVTSTKKKVDFRMPKQVVYNMAGVFYDTNDECITPEEAVKAVMQYPYDIIVKPTMRTTWGKGVIKLGATEKDADKVKSLFDKYKKDFSFEECVVQHPDLASFNESSLNTVRICTYRRPNGDIKILFHFQRFGKEGEVVDNASAGGNFVGIDSDGTFHRTIKQFKSLQTYPLADKVAEKVPYFERMKAAALYLHSKIPDLNIIGWDFTMGEDGLPIIIEFNNKPGVNVTQIINGPAFSKEDLDELMPLVATWKPSYICEPWVAFDDTKGFGGRLKY